MQSAPSSKSGPQVGDHRPRESCDRKLRIRICDESYINPVKCRFNGPRRSLRECYSPDLNQRLVPPEPRRAAADEDECFDVDHADGLTETMTHFDVGVPLRFAVLPSGTSGFASGKYAATQSGGILYGTTVKP
jgi:hypothetical protein